MHAHSCACPVAPRLGGGALQPRDDSSAAPAAQHALQKLSRVSVLASSAAQQRHALGNTHLPYPYELSHMGEAQLLRPRLPLAVHGPGLLEAECCEAEDSQYGLCMCM